MTEKDKNKEIKDYLETLFKTQLNGSWDKFKLEYDELKDNMKDISTDELKRLKKKILNDISLKLNN